MLPVDELDKKDYSEILEESIANIKRFSSEWTDFNYHDPGITMLEMLTWLTDMQRYYLNRVTKKNMLKFLDLYGIRLAEQSKAKSYVGFQCSNDSIIMSKGVKLKADEQVFETMQSAALTNNSIKKFITATEYLETDNTHVIFNGNLGLYPFDKAIKDGNKLYLAFENEIPIHKKINIYFDVIDDYLVKLNDTEKLDYHITYKWMFYSKEDKWKDIRIVNDETKYLTQKGNVTIVINSEMQQYDFFNNGDSYYWICIEAQNVGYNLSPKISTIALNYMPVENRNTYIKYKDFKRKDKNLFFNNIYLKGKITVQYKYNDKYIDLKENDDYTIQLDTVNKKLIVSQIDEKYQELRLISCLNDLKYKKEIGLTNGLSYQKIYYPLNNVVPEELVLQVGEYNGDIMLWSDYHYVKSFSMANKGDKVFEIDNKNQLIIFGDNENCIAPEKANSIIDNIRIINLVYSDCERGNVKNGEIKEFVDADEFKNISIVYTNSAVNGKKGMQIEDGIRELLNDNKKISRAITTEDYEKLAKNTPGLRIACAKALIDENTENKIIIVLVPYTSSLYPVPDEKMLNIVKKHINKYRLITTDVEVVAPKYVGVSVIANINVSVSNKFDLNLLKSKIKDFLTPISVDKIKDNYTIGREIYLSDIIEIINSFREVNCIDYLKLDCKGEGIKKDSEGNIILPYNAISYSNVIDINIY